MLYTRKKKTNPRNIQYDSRFVVRPESEIHVSNAYFARFRFSERILIFKQARATFPPENKNFSHINGYAVYIKYFQRSIYSTREHGILYNTGPLMTVPTSNIYDWKKNLFSRAYYNNTGTLNWYYGILLYRNQIVINDDGRVLPFTLLSLSLSLTYTNTHTLFQKSIRGSHCQSVINYLVAYNTYIILHIRNDGEMAWRTAIQL